MQDFKKLHVWGKAHALALNAHRVAGQIRGAANLSLRSQVVRAAMSIPANIVEGRAKHSEREFARFLRYALSSASELEYHLIASRDLGLIRESDFVSLLTQVIEVRRMIHGLLNRIVASAKGAPRNTEVEAHHSSQHRKSSDLSAGGRAKLPATTTDGPQHVVLGKTFTTKKNAPQKEARPFCS